MRRLLILSLTVCTLHAQDSAFLRRDVLPPDGRLPAARVVKQAGIRPASIPLSREADPNAHGDQEILVRQQGWEPWSVGFTSGWEHQSNAALGSQQEISDSVFRQTASLRAAFKLSDTLYQDSGVAQQSVRYDELDVLDFDRVDLDTGLLKALPESWPLIGGSVLSLRAGYYRLSTGGSFGDELFNNTSISPGLLHSLLIGEDHSILLSLNGEISLLASSETARRNEYSALAAWQARWSSRWESSLYLRTAFHDYDQHDDWNLTAGGGIDRIITPWCRLGISFSWAVNESDSNSFDYQNTGAGAALRLSLRF